MDYKKLFASKKIKLAMTAVALAVLLLAAFKAGEFAAYHKARFSYRWGENYHRMFAGPREGLFRGLRDFSGNGFLNAHGTAGSVMKIGGMTLIIKTKDAMEETVLVSDKTTIRRGGETVRISDLKTDDMVVVIGSPDDQGQIQAKFIRVFDASPNQKPQ